MEAIMQSDDSVRKQRMTRKSNSGPHGGSIWTTKFGKLFSLLVVAVMVGSIFGAMNFVWAAGAAEQFKGYDKGSQKWEGANLGTAYVEGDFVSYQLKIQDNSPIWGHDFNIRYNFHQDSSEATYIDGFDVSGPTGFQYTSTNDFLPDGTEVPSAGWGSHIQTQAAGDPIATVPQITHYMDPWPVGSTDGSPAGSVPCDERYFTVSGLPWGTFTSGYVIIFYRAHLALSIIWMNGLESALPQALDGNVFQTWTTPWNGASAATGSSRHFYLEYQGVGSKTIPIPIASYPSTMIYGHKYVGGVLYDGWEITLTGLLDLGPNLPSIPYNPPSVLTGMGHYSSGATWSTGYFEFSGLVTGSFVVSEEDRPAFGHYDIVTGGAAKNIIEDVAGGWVSFDLKGGTTATVDFYNSVATQTSTLLSASSITLGQSVYDTATVTATGVTPTGEVQFYVKVGAGAWTPLGVPVTLVNGKATSISYTPTSAGNYWFKAAYPGGQNFAASESGETEEPLVVLPATPKVVTLLSATSITLGETVYDTVTVTGLGGLFPVPSGTVQFYVKVDGGSWLPLGSPVALAGGQATSIDYKPLAAGSYWFKATYSGDSNYVGASSGETEEPLSVKPATPIVTTLLSATSVTLGGKVHDTVTVTGLGGAYPMPTGTVQFYVKVGAGAWTPLGAPIALVDGKASSIDYTPLAAGSYWFKATYSGDSNYVGASSGETEEPLSVGPATPTVTTLLSATSITLGGSVYDTVTVTGLGGAYPAPTGTVQFYVKVGAGAWTPLGAPVALVDGKASSIDYTPLAAGDYWFKATYSGDSNYVGASSGETEEPLSVKPATPIVTTLLSSTSITLGGKVHDTVTVTGLGGAYPMPTGTVQFYVKVGAGAWTPLGAPVTLVSGQATSIDYTPLAAGSYWFKATYSGDSNYVGASSGETEEPLSVGPATPTVTTLLSSSSITLGDKVYDTVTVTGLAPPFPSPTGTVQFYVKVGAGAWTPLGAPVALVDGKASSIDYTPLAAGDYWFKATYSGDSNYVGASSGDNEEPLAVGPATPKVVTLLSDDSIVLGGSVYDTVTVSGIAPPFPGPTGTVQFYVKIDAGSWTPLGAPVALVDGKANSIDYTPLAAGDYWFKAVYSGDSNYIGAQSGETEEPLKVSPATPKVSTLLSATSITLGGKVHDTVTVTGLAPPFPGPTGTVQFYVKVGAGAWTPLGAPVALVDGKASSIDYTPLAAGDYWFKATYSGDSNYVGASSGETEEPLSVGPATPTVTTLLSSSSITLGGTVFDTVTVTGLGGGYPVPTGTVQFWVKVGAGAWEPLGSPVALVDGQAKSIDYTPLAAGAYWFKATYSGDANYVKAASGDTEEPLTVEPATPKVTTLLSATSVVLGGKVYDTVTVTGLGGSFPIPTGTVQFYVKVDMGAWTPLGSPVALVSGQATSIDYIPLAAGSYWFKATYSGDSNYVGASSGDTEEPLTVEPATPKVTTLLSATSVVLGGKVYDTVKVTGLGGSFPIPTGTVQFWVKVGAGAWEPLGAPVELIDGQATSIDYIPLAAGSYWFKATYSGDANYVRAASGETEEPLTVDPATPTVTTLLSATSIMWGQTVHDTATVTGLAPPFPMPTGTVQFYVRYGTGAWEPLGAPVELVNGQAVSIDYTPSTGGNYWFKAVYSGDSNYVRAASGETDEPLTVFNLETRTLGYWKNHPAKWVGISPNTPFPWTVGRASGMTYMQILKLQPRGDATIILAHQYIAAVLNMNAFGASDQTQDWIEQAEHIFGDWPVGSNPPSSDPVRNEIITLAGWLDDYNNSGDM